MRRLLTGAGLVVAMSWAMLGCGPAEAPKPAGSVTILWAEWAPADLLQTLTQDFTRETGITVTVVQEPWGTWQTRFFDAMARKSREFDMVVGDSQWLGRGAEGGHYVELTRWMKARGVDRSMTPASIRGYAEYPKGSGHLWAVPLEGDAMGFSYRKDLFEDPGERAAFEARTGYPLAVPETWHQLRDIAAFFHRPEKGLYGVLAWTEPHYDGLTMGVQSLVWAWGADLGDPETHRVRDILNSPEGVAALEFYKSLNRYNNPEWRDHYLDTKKSSNAPMMAGRVAMAMGYFAINVELLDPARNPRAADMGFFANPAGPKARVSSLGGQGVSVVSTTKKKDLCFRFLEWFIREDVQRRWADLGGLTCNRRVLGSERFLNASPINRPFKASIEMARDFWAVPEYDQLLSVSQKHWSEAVAGGAVSAGEAMDAVAREWEEIFEYAGYYRE